jgi:hypothetical protein
MPSKDSTPIRMGVICLHAPPATNEGKAAFFGLQDKAQALLEGQPRDDGALQFDFELDSKGAVGQGAPDFSGKFAHGTPNARFLYLSYGYPDSGKLTWIFRIKIPLRDITWDIINAASNAIIEGAVDGRRAATVPPMGGWLAR